MKKFNLFLALAMICAFANAQTIEKNYSFNEPTFSQIRGHEQLMLDGCMQSALIGQPCLPWQQVSLMLPEGQEAQSIEVILSDFVELEGTHDLFPFQPSRTTGDNTPRALVKDETVYSSRSVYPAENHGVITTQYKNGYGFAFSSFTPVQYIPATGKVMMAKKAMVKVHLTPSKTSHSSMLWGTSSVKESVRRLAQNPEMVESYQTRGREVTDYDILIITDPEFFDAYNAYRDYYTSIGLRNRIVAVSDIYDNMSGVDNQDKIRNYIIQEYQEKGIIMVILGGDTNIVPYRGLYCYVTSGGGDQESNNIPADLYYSALDGTWNENGNNRWGEPGEDDLVPEIGISRMSFKTTEELNNIIHKTLNYQQNPVLGEFRKIVLAGEHLYDNPTSNGSDYLELLIGTHDDNGYTTTCYPTDYNFIKLYEEEGNWSGYALRQAINSGIGYVHHDGHANSSYVAGWYDISNSDFNGANGSTHNYTFFHSQGCDCGAFDGNCILEKMVTIPNFAVAVIGNSRYGWFNEGQTEGPGAHLEREMTDAQFNDRIDLLGCALSEGKSMTAPWVTAPGQWEEGALRWNFYDMNVLGDGAVSVWLDEPFTSEIDYQSQITVGTPSTTVTVTDPNGNGLYNFRCSIFHEDELIGFATTDEQGVAEIEFSIPIDFVDEFQLIVTGANAWPQTLTGSTIPNNTAYVIFNEYVINDGDDSQADFGESFSLDLSLRNVGSLTASNVNVTLSTDSPYVTITDNAASFSDIYPNQIITLNEVFAITVSDNVPDMTNAKFFLTCTDGTDIWTSKFFIKLHAPLLEITNIVIDDTNGNNNGDVDPGETVTLYVTVANNGSCNVFNIVLDIYNNLPEITFEEEHLVIEQLEPDQDFLCSFVFTLSEEAEVGVAYQLPISVYSGNYIDEDLFTFSVGKIMDGFETGDFSAFNWRHGSAVTAWEVVNNMSYEGSYCAKSAAIDDYEASVLYLDFDFPVDDEISFYYKVSSEANYDLLIFSIDNSEKGSWSGEVPWTLATYPITQGTHRLKWQYTKDVSYSSGQDCAWIDNVVFPPSQTITLVEETISTAPSLYPNPNQGQFNINLPETPCTVTVFNNMGQVVFRQEALQGTTTLNLQHLANGLYLLQVSSSECNNTQKFVKK